MKGNIGIYSWFGAEMHMSERLKLIKDAGFDSTMLWWGDQVAFWDFDKVDLINEVNRFGLTIENIHLPYYEIHHLWDNTLKTIDVIKAIKEGIDDCYRFGIEGIVIHIENDLLINYNKNIGLENLRRLVHEAEKKDVLIAIENTKNNQIVDYVFEELKNNHLKFCYDSSHDWLKDGSKSEMILKYADRLQYLHLSDNDLEFDRHWIPGEGLIQWGKVVENLKLAKYNGTISFEVCPFDYAVNGNELLKKVHEFGRSIAQQLEIAGVAYDN
ncbi:MAG: sugar phosphate isomerase/epimerase [Dethiosulfatibacter sp.]|nr:sugar phosphate isomerase/epimerase [Dethiosulfatibacter sp.]